jgi:2-oxoisovalerate dehydrogenase E2 component (dihydrolipoyl transacylase)
MAEHVIRLPDVGEGVAEAELVEWQVKIGDLIGEDAILAAVMTDKATVEIPSPVAGEVLWLGGEVGDVIAVGSELVRLKVAGKDNRSAADAAPEASVAKAAAEMPRHARSASTGIGEADRPGSSPTDLPAVTSRQPVRSVPPQPFVGGAPRPEGEKPLAAPAVRMRAREAGVDLRQVPGTGPAGRITHEDLDALFAHGTGAARAPARQAKTGVKDVRLVGLRRKIAEKMALASSRIPHITYVEEVDVTALEEFRATLNKQKRQDRPRLTLLPFLMRAMTRAIAEQPDLNALFDDAAGVVHVHAGIHIGIAVQTPAGLLVPVVRHVETLDLWDCGAELNRLAEAAKAGTAIRDELSGSTITVTSLGAMGGVVTTPIINHPEVAIIGVNKIMVRPVWSGSTFVPRKMMNLSSSFDHRVVDGWDAARFVQRIKALLETPALIFMED